MTDYKRAFYIACDLLNGDVLYGIDKDKIFTESMDKYGCCFSNSYRNYILTHMDKLDKGQYKEALEQKPKTKHCEDCKWWKDSDGKYRRGCGAESRCPINTYVVYCGEGYCYLFEPQESEE